MADWLGLAGLGVLVAGGAGTIGTALVDGFLEAGATVAVLDLHTEGVDRRVSAMREVDLSDGGAARRAVAGVRDELGALDAFVHCVGINDRKPIENYSGDEWDRMLAINLSEEVVGPVLFLCSRHASFITGQVLYIDGGRTIV